MVYLQLSTLPPRDNIDPYPLGFPHAGSLPLYDTVDLARVHGIDVALCNRPDGLKNYSVRLLVSSMSPMI